MGNPNLEFTTALAATFAALGVEHVCISPGSRNAPLIAGFAAQGRIRGWRILDERSAGFFAVGLARVTGRPVALACTSGTAAVEYHPAVVEASQSEVPLLVLTADRPPELRGIGAPQTIDQVGLYGVAVRAFYDVAAPNETTDPAFAGELATSAWTAATAGRPGPVHLNLGFAEPLLTAAPLPAAPPVVPPRPAPSETDLDLGWVAERLTNRRGIIVAGRSNNPSFPAAASQLARRLGFPIFADPLSGLRHGGHPREQVLATGDLNATAGVLDRLPPEVILRFGPVPTSKPLWQWLSAHPEIEQILIDLDGRDATRSAATVLAMEPGAAATALGELSLESSPPEWLETWQAVDNTAATAAGTAAATAPFPNEPEIARIVMQHTATTAVTVGSSMPIRDVDSFGGTSGAPLRVFGNRGANGIDGVVSAALGTAAAGLPATALVGDVSMFHDLNVLGTAAQLELPLTIVVVNNDGGGIFSFLPHADPDILDKDVFTEYLATPHGTSFAPVATALGIETHTVKEAAELRKLVATPGIKPRLIELHTDRATNVALHRSINAAVRTAVTGRLP